MVITTCSSGIISSMEISPPAYSMTERRSSPYLAFISKSSSLIISVRRSLRARISSKSIICANNCSYSSLVWRINSLLIRRSCRAKIASACISVSSNSVIKSSLGLSWKRMISIAFPIVSSVAITFMNPSKIWIRSLAFLSSYSVRLYTTSWRCSTKWYIKSLRFSCWGRPLTKAILLTLKEDCNAVCLKRLFSTTLGIASFLSSYTMRIPPLPVWSTMSASPSSLPSLTRFEVCSRIVSGFTW